jgi:hypothetical protein
VFTVTTAGSTDGNSRTPRLRKAIPPKMTITSESTTAITGRRILMV